MLSIKSRFFLMASYETLVIQSRQLYPNFYDALQTWQSTQPRVMAGTKNSAYIGESQNATTKLKKTVADAVEFVGRVEDSISSLTNTLDNDGGALSTLTQEDAKLKKEGPGLQYSLDTAVGLYENEREKYILALVEMLVYLTAVGIAVGNIYDPDHANIFRIILNFLIKPALHGAESGINYAGSHISKIVAFAVRRGVHLLSEN